MNTNSNNNKVELLSIENVNDSIVVDNLFKEEHQRKAPGYARPQPTSSVASLTGQHQVYSPNSKFGTEEFGINKPPPE